MVNKYEYFRKMYGFSVEEFAEEINVEVSEIEEAEKDFKNVSDEFEEKFIRYILKCDESLAKEADECVENMKKLKAENPELWQKAQLCASAFCNELTLRENNN